MNTDRAAQDALEALHDYFCHDGRDCPIRQEHNDWIDAACIAVEAARPALAEEVAASLDALGLSNAAAAVRTINDLRFAQGERP